LQILFRDFPSPLLILSAINKQYLTSPCLLSYIMNLHP
jgi:hypothetical protein